MQTDTIVGLQNKVGFLRPLDQDAKLSMWPHHEAPTTGMLKNCCSLVPLGQSLNVRLALPTLLCQLIRTIRLDSVRQVTAQVWGVLFPSMQRLRSCCEGCDRACFSNKDEERVLQPSFHHTGDILNRALHKLLFKRLTQKHILTCSFLIRYRPSLWFALWGWAYQYKVLPLRAFPVTLHLHKRRRGKILNCIRGVWDSQVRALVSSNRHNVLFPLSGNGS